MSDSVKYGSDNVNMQPTSKIFSRPCTSDGTPTGIANIKGVGSLGTPLDYYVEALEGERLMLSRIIPHVVDTGSFDSGSYGNGVVLTNGIQLFWKTTYNGSPITLDFTPLFPIKTNIDWARFCYDIAISSFGLGDEGLGARWTFTRHGNVNGIVLEEGDRFGMRLRDDLSGLVEQTLMVEGTHLGEINSAWLITL